MFDYRIGDCRDLLKTIPDASVRLVVTSPPYDIGKAYGKYQDKVGLDSWLDMLDEVVGQISRILTPDGAFFLNLSPVPVGTYKEIIPLQVFVIFLLMFLINFSFFTNFAQAALSSSHEMLTKQMFLSAYFFSNSAKKGCSFRQGPHQVAQ